MIMQVMVLKLTWGSDEASDTPQGPTVSILKSEHGAMRQPAKERGPQRKSAIPHSPSKPLFLELPLGKSGEKLGGWPEPA